MADLTSYLNINKSWVYGTFFAKVGGAWRKTNTGTYQVWRKVNGTWQEILQLAYDVLLPGTAQTVSNAVSVPSSVSIELLPDGRIEKKSLGTFYDDYLDASLPETGVGADYKVTVTENASSPDPVSSLDLNAGIGSALALSSSRKYSVYRSSNGTTEVWLDVKVEEVADSANTDTQTYKLKLIYTEGDPL